MADSSVKVTNFIHSTKPLPLFPGLPVYLNHAGVSEYCCIAAVRPFFREASFFVFCRKGGGGFSKDFFEGIGEIRLAFNPDV